MVFQPWSDVKQNLFFFYGEPDYIEGCFINSEAEFKDSIMVGCSVVAFAVRGSKDKADQWQITSVEPNIWFSASPEMHSVSPLRSSWMFNMSTLVLPNPNRVSGQKGTDAFLYGPHAFALLQTGFVKSLLGVHCSWTDRCAFYLEELRLEKSDCSA